MLINAILSFSALILKPACVILKIKSIISPPPSAKKQRTFRDYIEI